ncbi:MAG: TolC family protein [Gemmatimonadota bacterium]
MKEAGRRRDAGSTTARAHPAVAAFAADRTGSLRRRAAVLAAGLLVALVAPAPAQRVLSLEDALHTALARNPSIESASAAAAAAASARWADWGAFLPTATTSISFTSNKFTNVTFLSPEGVSQRLDEPIKSTSKSASQALTLGLSLFELENVANLKSGAASEEAAFLRLTEAERRVIRDVKQAYFEALKQQRLVEVAERQLESRRQDQEITARRYRIAAASRSDLLGAQIDASDAELRLFDARDARAAALRSLQVLLGIDPTEEPASPVLRDVEELPDAGSLDAELLVGRAMRSNPGLRARESDRAAASASVWAARASFLPRFTASLSFSRSEQLGPGDALFNFSPDNTNRNLSITGSWSLFNGFARKRQTAEASQRLRQSEADLTDTRHRLEKDVRDLVAEIRRRSRRLELIERNLELARERLDLARQQYRLGSIPYFNLQQAIDRLTLAEQQLFQERYDYLIRWAELEERLGGEVR